jgi:hypothetical protein
VEVGKYSMAPAMDLMNGQSEARIVLGSSCLINYLWLVINYLRQHFTEKPMPKFVYKLAIATLLLILTIVTQGSGPVPICPVDNPDCIPHVAAPGPAR